MSSAAKRSVALPQAYAQSTSNMPCPLPRASCASHLMHDVPMTSHSLGPLPRASCVLSKNCSCTSCMMRRTLPRASYANHLVHDAPSPAPECVLDQMPLILLCPSPLPCASLPCALLTCSDKLQLAGCTKVAGPYSRLCQAAAPPQALPLERRSLQQNAQHCQY